MCLLLIPFSYNLRSLWVRRSSTLLTVTGIGATVAVLSGILALQQGFTTLFRAAGREDVALFLRPGAPSEGESVFTREGAQQLVKSVPEIAAGADGEPLASAELYSAVRRFKIGGGETNVPIRGVQPASFAVTPELSVTEGRRFEPGTDEVIVGRRLTTRIQDCAVGDVIQIDTVPFRVVGIFDYDGHFASEIWGDLDRLLDALDRPGPSSVVARLREGADVAALSARLEHDKQVPAAVKTERAYLASMSAMLSVILLGLGTLLAVIMGVAAVFTATNTMLSAVAMRVHEIGILRAIGYRPLPIFLSFLLEATLLGLLGGVVGSLITLPLNGVETGTSNFQTFTEVAFAFRITPVVLLTAAVFSLILGLLGGAWPAWRAARMTPTEALRRQ
jgi:putative ABC transport system permease protein